MWSTEDVLLAPTSARGWLWCGTITAGENGSRRRRSTLCVCGLVAQTSQVAAGRRHHANNDVSAVSSECAGPAACSSPFPLFPMSPFHLFTFSPFHPFTFSPFHLFTFSPLHLFPFSPFTLHLSHTVPFLFVAFHLSLFTLHLSLLAPHPSLLNLCLVRARSLLAAYRILRQ